MARVKTFNNGPGVSAQVLPSDLNALQDEYELAFASYKRLVARGGTYNAPAAGTFVMSFEINGAGGGVPTHADYSFYSAPADSAAAGAGATPRVTKLRLRGTLWTGSPAPATTLTFGMYPVATWGTAA